MKYKTAWYSSLVWTMVIGFPMGRVNRSLLFSYRDNRTGPQEIW